MKRTVTISLIVLVLLISGYLFLRFYLLRAKDFKPETAKAKSVVDLRPALIARLRQMVKDGSDGLYQLTIGEIEPDIASGSVRLKNLSLRVDSGVLHKLDSLYRAPDDVYSVSVQELLITGLGIGELLSTKNIDLDKISISNPVLTVYRQTRAYNSAERARKDSLTLYQRLSAHTNHISVKTILVNRGSFVSRNLSRKTHARIDRVSVHMDDLRIDSATQSDNNRFLFARKALISAGRFQQRTADSLYFFGVDSVSIDAAAHTMTVQKLELVPRFSKTAFQKRRLYRNDRFELAIPRIVLTGMDWWALFNSQSLTCNRIDTYNGYLRDYVNGSLPLKPVRPGTFPYQALRNLSLAVNIKKINMHHFRLAYEEYFPPSGQNGTVYFDDINAQLTNIINIPAYIRPGMQCTATATALFMHKTPMRARFGFDMNRYRSGNFLVDLHLGKVDEKLLNPVTEPLALLSVKSGVVQDLTAHISGNNDQANARLTMLYDDLHITTLKKEKTEKGELKKKRLVNFFANTFLIKNSNSAKDGAPRTPEVSIGRDKSASFFNFVWRAVRLAVLKSVGIPETFAPK